MRALRPLACARRNARPGARSATIAAAATALALVLGLLALGQRPVHGGATTVSDVLKVGNTVSRRTALAVNPAGVPSRAVETPQYPCSQLASEDFSQLAGAPTTILSATLVTPSSTNGVAFPYCDVSGIVAPQVQFELQLPTQTYTGRYLQEGCGGYCGSVGVSQPAASGQAGIDECVPLNNGQFVLGQDDEGHIGGGNVEAWAIDDPMLKVDFGYLSEHVFAVAAKAIIASFYGHAPAYSYYDGCSDGGREALMEAQRSPTTSRASSPGRQRSTRPRSTPWRSRTSPLRTRPPTASRSSSPRRPPRSCGCTRSRRTASICTPTASPTAPRAPGQGSSSPPPPPRLPRESPRRTRRSSTASASATCGGLGCGTRISASASTRVSRSTSRPSRSTPATTTRRTCPALSTPPTPT